MKNILSLDQKLNSKKGFSLVEILVVFGMLAIIAGAIASIITAGAKQQKGVQAKDQQREVTAEIRTLLNNKTACLNSFGRQDPSVGFTTATIKDAANIVRYTVGTNDKTGFLKFEEFGIANWVADAGYTTQGLADLKIKLSKVGDTGSIKDLKPDIITLKIKLLSTGNISECFSIGSQSDGFWQANPASISDIFYGGGNVGIGTNAPSAVLDVLGSGATVTLLKVTGNISNVATNAFGENIAITYSPTASSSLSVYGSAITSTYSAAAGINTSGNVIGIDGFAVNDSPSASVQSIIGGNFHILNSGSGTTSNYGLKSVASSGTTVISSYGLHSEASAYSGSMTNGNGVHALVSVTGSSPLISDARGVFSEVLNTSTGGSITRGYGIYTGNIQAMQKWSVYASDGGAPSYFAGNVSIGLGGGIPQAALDVVALTENSAIIVPRASAAARPPSPVNGMIRYNTTTALFEFYQNGSWVNYTTISDGRLKTNVIPVNQGLNILNQLNPVYFDWDQKNPRAQGFGTKHQVGFIGQEVQKVLPEVVNKGEDSYLTIEYGKIVSIVVAAVKQLYTRVLSIETRQSYQEQEMVFLNNKVTKLEVENAAKIKKIKELEQRLEKIEKTFLK